MASTMTPDAVGGEKAREVGERIKQARLEMSGMTQEELAALVGVSPRSIQAYESGEVLPYKQMDRLQEVLQKPVGWFLHGEEALKPADVEMVVGLRDELLTRFDEIQRRFDATTERLDQISDQVATNSEIIRAFVAGNQYNR